MTDPSWLENLIGILLLAVLLIFLEFYSSISGETHSKADKHVNSVENKLCSDIRVKEIISALLSKPAAGVNLDYNLSSFPLECFFIRLKAKQRPNSLKQFTKCSSPVCQTELDDQQIRPEFMRCY